MGCYAYWPVTLNSQKSIRQKSPFTHVVMTRRLMPPKASNKNDFVSLKLNLSQTIFTKFMLKLTSSVFMGEDRCPPLNWHWGVIFRCRRRWLRTRWTFSTGICPTTSPSRIKVKHSPISVKRFVWLSTVWQSLKHVKTVLTIHFWSSFQNYQKEHKLVRSI